MTRGELALVPAHELLAAGEPEVLLVDHHSGQARPRPPLASSAVAEAHGPRILDLVLDTTAEAGPLQCLRHGNPPLTWVRPHPASCRNRAGKSVNWVRYRR